MKKLILFLAVVFFIANANSYADVATDYTFSQTLEPYTEITGGVIIASATHTSINPGTLHDVTYGPIALPFTFGFNNCIPYNSYYISTNGFITFGGTAPAVANYGPISSSEVYAGAVSAYGLDLIGIFSTTADFSGVTNVLTDVRNFEGVVVGRHITAATGIPADTYITSFDEGLRTITMSKSTTDIIVNDLEVQTAGGSIETKVEGASPNQVLTIQWKNFRQYLITGGTDDNFNFQIKLYEFDGVIKVIYGNMDKSTTPVASVVGQVGLRGLSNADFNNRTNTVTSNWALSLAGISNAETSMLHAVVFPLEGWTYKWSPACVLPVEMSSFFSSISNRDVTLNWTTFTETNNSHYDIERLIVNGERLKVGTVTGNGTTTTPNSYSFTDRNLATGKYNYRLKQIDFNGSFEYFNLSNEVNVGIPVKFDLSQNYPNPFNPTTQINYDLPFDGNVSLKLYDMTGKEVMTLVNEVKSAGYYSINLNAANLSSGVYFYTLSSNNFTATKKLMLIR